jgi:peptidoglycan/LPS O-acetylase OafA/YrhL
VTARRRLHSLDALRALAAILVLAFHFEGLLYTDPPNYVISPDGFWLHYALLGVELFFVISGFVILMTLESALTIRDFAINRVARLYPAYWLSVALAFSYFALFGRTSIATLFVNLTMLQKFVWMPNLITPYWSLAYELWFYVAMASVAALGQLERVVQLSFAWLILAAGMILCGFRPQGLLGLLTLLQFGHLFIAGMMLYLIYSNRKTPLVWTVLAMSICFSLFGRPDWSLVSNRAYFLVNASFIVLVYLASSGRLDKIAFPWLTAIGASSYSLYLLHLPIALFLWSVAVGAGYPRWVGILVAVPASLVAAALSRRLIEIPGQRLLRRMAANWSLRKSATFQGQASE